MFALVNFKIQRMEYQLNKHGVFLKPEKVEIDNYVIVSLAVRNNKWYYGYIYNYSLSFASSPCMEILSLGYNTRNEALKSAIKTLIYKIDRDRERHHGQEYYKSDTKRMSLTLRNLKEYLFNISHVQLSLFD